MGRACHCQNLPTRRVKANNLIRAGELKEQGKTYAEIGAILGVAPSTAKNYANNATRGDGRNHGGDLPRCQCGLLLPCTCTGPMHAVDFLGRRGESVPVAMVGRFHG